MRVVGVLSACGISVCGGGVLCMFCKCGRNELSACGVCAGGFCRAVVGVSV